MSCSWMTGDDCGSAVIGSKAVCVLTTEATSTGEAAAGAAARKPAGEVAAAGEALVAAVAGAAATGRGHVRTLNLRHDDLVTGRETRGDLDLIAGHDADLDRSANGLAVDLLLDVLTAGVLMQRRGGDHDHVAQLLVDQ